MKPVCTILMSFCLCAAAQAQALPISKDFSATGKFWVSVDDEAVILINGEQAHKAGIGESTSQEIALKPGDRVVVRLKNNVGPRRFKLLFVSGDRRHMVNFGSRAFKILPDPEIADFTDVQFCVFPKHAVKDNKIRDEKLPFKNSSDWVWGETDNCVLGALIAWDMFKPMPRQ